MIFNQDTVARPKSLADLATPLIARIQHEDVPYYRSSEISLTAFKVLYGLAGAEAQKKWATAEMISAGSAKNLILSDGATCGEALSQGHLPNALNGEGSTTPPSP